MLNNISKPITSKEMKSLDSRAINELGIPQAVLMENAGKKVFDAITQHFGLLERACVVCGKGNNGGDAKIAARYLKNSGCKVKVLEVEKDGASVINEELCKAGLVIDGIFGIGLDRQVEGAYAEAILLINEGRKNCGCKVVSVDIPSGLDADSGIPKEVCVEADLTVTFHLPKVGMFKGSALSKIGKLVVADIGIPYDKYQILNTKSPSTASTSLGTGSLGASQANPKSQIPNSIDVGYVKKCLPQRKVDANKGDNGRVMIFAGSRGMSGAAVMAGRAALRSGAGLVYLSVPKEIQNPVNISVPEIITISDVSIAQMLKIKLSAVGVGPGIGADKKNMVERLIRSELKCPLIIDADGLNSISNNPAVLLKRKSPVIITPHPGEMARLLKTTAAMVQEDRVNIALRAAKDWNIIVVLKGAYTVIADPCGQHFINTTGNPGLATAGTGDVLTGILCALAGQGVEPFKAAVCACFIHGMCGDAVALNKGQMGMIASDIIEAIPFVVNSITKAA